MELTHYIICGYKVKPNIVDKIYETDTYDLIDHWDKYVLFTGDDGLSLNKNDNHGIFGFILSEETFVFKIYELQDNSNKEEIKDKYNELLKSCGYKRLEKELPKIYIVSIYE
jgi:hypothetical protein